MSAWWSWMVEDARQVLMGFVVALGIGAVLLLIARWLFRAGGPLNK